MKNISSSCTFLILVAISLISLTASAQFGASPWTAPDGTFTVPAGVTSISVECWGGGGGGGGAKENGLVQSDGGGGGGGANAVRTSYTVVPGQTITVTNGAGGTAGASTPTAGGHGGASLVVYNVGPDTVAMAAGGSGGSGILNNFANGGAGGSTGKGTIHNGGNGAAGTSLHGGGGGGSGGNTGNGFSGNSNSAGAGGTTDGAFGGNGAGVNDPGSAPGSIGQAPGGGGGGAAAVDFNNFSTRQAAGGAGAAGRVIITYTVVVCTPPTTQAVGPLSFNSITDNSMNYAFTRGNGDNVMVVCRAGSPVSPDPVLGTSYTANPAYGTGTAVGGGFCVYNGAAAGPGNATGNIALTGLTCLTTYYFAIYEYNTTGTCYVMPALTGNATATCSTAPAAPVSAAGTGAAGTSFTANWAASACATGYRLDVSTDNAFSTYVTGYQDLDVLNVLTKNVTGLTSGTTYYYRVRAYNTCGTSTNSTVITIATTATPSITSFTPTSACAGSGTVITITGTFLNGATAVNFNGTPAASFTVNSATEIVATLPAGATTGTITVTGPGGTATSSTNLTVNQTPVATATPSSQTICSGSSATIALSSSVGGSTYTWSRTMPGSIAGTMPTNGTTNPTGTMISSGSTPVTVTFTITPAANGCTGNDITATVEIQSAPDAPGVITGSDTVCANGTYTYSIIAVSGATGYTWVLPNGWTGTSTSNGINPTSGATGGNITVTADNNCGSSTAQTKTVYVIPTISMPGTISGPDSLCNGSSGQFSVAPVSGATSYTWTLPNGWSGGSSTESLTATAGASGGNIMVVANNDCGSSSAQTHAVGISTTAPTLSAITGAGSACSGNATTYSVNATGGASSYTWTLPNGWSGTSTTGSISATPGPTGGTISVIANSPCGNSSPQTLTVTVENAPATPGTITGPGSLCAGNAGNYSVAAVNGATGYTWTLPGGWTGNSISETIHATSSATGGSVSITADNNCGSSAAQTLSVTVNPIPQVDFNFTGNPVCKNGGAVTLNGTPSGGTYSGPGVSGGSFNPSTLSAGNYDVIYSYTDGNSCGASDTSTITVTICSGIDAVATNGGINVYPNPLETGTWNLDCTTEMIGSKLEIFDANGRLVFKSEIRNPKFEIELNAAKGIYLMKINSNKESRTIKLIKL